MCEPLKNRPEGMCCGQHFPKTPSEGCDLLRWPVCSQRLHMLAHKPEERSQTTAVYLEMASVQVLSCTFSVAFQKTLPESLKGALQPNGEQFRIPEYVIFGKDLPCCL